MTGGLFPLYKEVGMLNADVDILVDDLRWMAVGSGAGKAITGATNATPISITCTSHGYTTGDKVMIKGVGGNTAANGIFTITNTGTNTFTLQDGSGNNVAGNGAYTSGGLVLNLTANDYENDITSAIIATTSAVTSKTTTKGVFDHADVTFSAVTTGLFIEWFILKKHTGTTSTSILICAVDGWSGAANPIPTNGGDVTLQISASGVFIIAA